jgi:hypothetical protein
MITSRPSGFAQFENEVRTKAATGVACCTDQVALAHGIAHRNIDPIEMPALCYWSRRSMSVVTPV